MLLTTLGLGGKSLSVVDGAVWQIEESQYQLSLIFTHDISLNMLREAVKHLGEQRCRFDYPSKIRVVFKNPSRYYSRRKWHTVTQFDTGFFYPKDSLRLCYTTTGRSGYYVDERMDYQNIKELVLISPNEPKDNQKKLEQFAKRLARERYDEQTWSDLKAETFYDGYKFYDITKTFDRYDLAEIKRGFETKSSFHVADYAQRRDFSAEGRLCEDGIYRAWFSSEFKGCGNGAYYLLLNPTTAVFREND